MPLLADGVCECVEPPPTPLYGSRGAAGRAALPAPSAPPLDVWEYVEPPPLPPPPDADGVCECVEPLPRFKLLCSDTADPCGERWCSEREETMEAERWCWLCCGCRWWWCCCCISPPSIVAWLAGADGTVGGLVATSLCKGIVLFVLFVLFVLLLASSKLGAVSRPPSGVPGGRAACRGVALLTDKIVLSRRELGGWTTPRETSTSVRREAPDMAELSEGCCEP